MKRQVAIFLAASLVITVVGLMAVPQTFADLTTMLPGKGDVLGTTFTLQPKNVSLDKLELADAQRIMSRRLDQLNLTGPYKIVLLPEADQLRVTVPENNDTPHVINVITHVGDIAFIDGGAASPPIGEKISLSAHAEDQLSDYQPLFTGTDIDMVLAPETNNGDLFYQIKLQADAASRLNLAGNTYVCLVLDETVTNCSKMYHWFGDALEILPNLSDDTGISLLDLGVLFDSGPLPAPFEVVD
jgi:hypothetical protein